MAGFYGIESQREVIRVHVKKSDGLLQPEFKKFSIDPQITSFEMLQNLLAKAFDIQSDFTISYASQDGGQDVYLSMLSDWDMDAAFQNASDPCLKLKVDLKPFDDALEDWDIIAPVEIPQYRMTFLDRSNFFGNITGTISNKMGKTVNQVQRAIGMKTEDEQQYRPVKAPMSDMEFRNYMDSDGHMVKPGEFRLSIYQGGVENSLRRVVWRHLLNIYPESMSGRERFAYMKKKENEYFELRDKWRQLFNERKVSEDIIHVATLVKKDVLRTDRGHKYYSGGDDSKNLIALYNLLVTYALTHPEVSYCQGMSDIASPILVVQKEEAQAYLCFCGLMKRLRSNFLYDGEAITTKLQHLSLLVQFYDPVFHSYMKEHGADDLFFCYRWLLLELKREFPFEDALYMLEVMWSTLPPNPPEEELTLTDSDYCPSLLVTVSPNSPSFAVKTQYSHLLAKRRLSTIVKDNSGLTAHSPKTGMASPKTATLILENGLDDKLQTVKEERSESKMSSNTDNLDFEPSMRKTGSMDGKIVTKNHPTDDENIPGILKQKEDILSKPDDALNNVNSEIRDDTSESITYNEQNVMDCVKHNDLKKERKDEMCKSDDKSRDSSEGSSPSEKWSSYYSPPMSLPSDNGQLISSSVSSASYLSSQSEDRFPSLISASVDSRIVDSETEVICSTEGMILSANESHYVSSEIPMGLSSSPAVNNNNTICEDENDDHAQFHLSLEKNESDILKKASSTNVPQIKGSFFSGMKRILMSPKHRPGKAQPVNVAQNVDAKNNSNIKNNVNGPLHRSMVDYRNTDDNDTEHTLFEVNRLMRSHSLDSDSGNGSLVSSLNSASLHPNSTGTSGHNSKKKKTSQPKDILSTEHQNYFDKKYAEIMSEIPQPSEPSGNGGKAPSFCENHFSMNNTVTTRTDETKEKDDISVCQEAVDICQEAVDQEEIALFQFKQLPAPDQFGYGNPFLMFACLTLLLQHRDVIVNTGMEYDELAMYFDKRVRKHHVNKVLQQARQLYTEYIRMQQKLQQDKDTLPEFSV
ncbi:TBC25-like protein [Mya arenaria]|uniref:TBC25-like protein n=1 Tax=Mya arenaria TaxID=6604 RepID=A0ABY7FXB0_MYAAR|nr:uncharacterized protein LOC128217071 [Mya arenaria]WAR25371.1 TBC25-like protein [Mya arenaria]